MAQYGEGEVDNSCPETIFAQVAVCIFWYSRVCSRFLCFQCLGAKG